MRRYFVIGNPIEHSLSPELHNFWIKKNNINAIYKKIKLEDTELKDFINKLRNEEIHGINVTVPFKNKVIKYLDKLSLEVETTDSVNTIYKSGDDIIYNPKETQFLKKAKENGNRIENGKFMFIYQANQSFSIWNNVIPKIDEEVLKILE